MDALPLFVGLDLGTGGARAVVAASDGQVVSSGAADLRREGAVIGQDRHEQLPEDWWNAAAAAIQQALQALPNAERSRIQALAVDGTSGTVVGVDEQLVPTTAALMYNDARSTREAEILNAQAEEHCRRHGYRFGASFGLPKILWLRENATADFERTRTFLHQADYVVSRLANCVLATDYSNALKTGVDLVAEKWPSWLTAFDGVMDRLPDVQPPATQLGLLDDQRAANLGLPHKLPLIAGATDGTAGCLASGAKNLGDDNTTLGTTLVFKRLAATMATDPAGLLYSHKLPGGLWLPGAASNTGGEWLAHEFGNSDLGGLDQQASQLVPTVNLTYPLHRRGERFPFKSGDFTGWDCAGSEQERFAAKLQGTAFVERLGYEYLDRVCQSSHAGDVYATGGGSNSPVWMQIRADVTGRTYHRPRRPDAALGAAVLAAAAVHFDSLPQAINNMVQLETSFHPNERRTARYTELYEAFLEQLKQRGLLEDSP